MINDGMVFIEENPYPWNKRANVIWLESPAGVGWSWAGTKQDLSTNDMLQSQDALAALNSWFVKFPEFRKNPLYVSGESYAGIYVPYLAWQIYQQNLQAEFTPTLDHINLEGFMVGNGCTNWNYDNATALVETAANFNVIPYSLYKTFVDNECEFYFLDASRDSKSRVCLQTYSKIQTLIFNLDIYDLYRHVDHGGWKLEESRVGQTTIDGNDHFFTKGMTRADYTPWVPKAPSSTVYGDFLTSYMNRDDVRKAFNIPQNI